MRRVFANGFIQRGCKACGGINHARSQARCLSVEAFLALQAFAKTHGRNWRSALRALWESGEDDGPLRECRNVIGPTRLAKVFPEKVRVNEEAREEVKRAASNGELPFRAYDNREPGQ